MKMRRYETMEYGQNLGFCRVFWDDRDESAIAIKDGEIRYVRLLDKDRTADISPALIEQLAIEVNKDYDNYDGISDLELALDAMTENGCSSCPWRHECSDMEV